MDKPHGSAPRLRVVILQPQALVARDLAEGLTQIAPTAIVEIRGDLAGDNATYDLAFVGSKIAAAQNRAVLAQIETRADHIIIVGDPPAIGAETAPDYEHLDWPVSDSALANLIRRINAAS